MLLPLLLASALAAQAPLTTEAERSGFTRTGRYEEAAQLCRAFVRAYPGRARCDTFGTSPEGRALLALVVSADGTLTPRAAAAKQRPVVLFQGGIHAGEIDGKDAGFWLLRDLLDGKAAPGVLKQVTAVFVPIFNVDGHERFGKNNRPNQVGPEEMGWRATRQNLNLNRDYVKADAPEMVAMLGLLHTWDPLVYLDLHVTDGAKFQPDVSVGLEPSRSGAAGLRPLGLKLQQELFAQLKEQGHQPLDFYPSFRGELPETGFAYSVAPPRFSHGYWAQRNRFGILVETHSWRPYAHRVKTTRDILQDLLGLVAREGAALQATTAQADAAERAGEVREAVLAWENTEKQVTLPYLGYAYTKSPSVVTGETVVSYDDTKPEVWNVPYFPDVRPSVTVKLPRAGYLVPAAHAAWVRRKLEAHGLQYRVLAHALAPQPFEAFRAKEAKFSPTSFESHQPLKLEGQWAKETRGLPAGSLFVPVAQPGALLVAHLFEPQGADSLVAWGFFNPHFEQKEYIEDYVLEPFARELLAKDPAVKAEWEQKLKDPAFAKDARARTRFFFSRHPAYDAELNLYPVLRTDEAPR
ncbi:peptidase M14 [Aggregicoccus sp. 17bor-14]|uniref:M14 family zinc carboxypeptidase n=1 Tax=Myxococcaceae TaxID=31 RepID=UPI00129C5CDF|nr:MULTISPECIES: M14 family zinc carboxypeptidase [Myxococcaceae]MBF5042943.1 peptidase M14 [Simulacricoccus sp. 17bor-14]MRI88709.1 peptidase M14 [Aggregicoccus sp. 17bor-14]